MTDCEETKPCGSCGVTKSIQNFYRRVTKGKEYPQSWCKACTRANRKEHYQEQKAHKDDPSFKKHKKPRYMDVRGCRITLEEFRTLQKDQKNVCKLCGNPETKVHNITKRVQELSVDHCHITGRIRGLLCSRCNMVLGRCNDDPTLLRRMADYLEQNSLETKIPD